MSAESGVIHDIGYRRYDRAAAGPGRRSSGPCTWHSLRLGLRPRPRRQGQDRPGDRLRDHVPARGGERGRGGQRRPRPVVRYDTYVFQLRVVVMIIFVAAQAPELVSRDLRSHVLPLYFSRPLRRMDYPLAKLAAFITRLPGHDRDPAAAALPGHGRPGRTAAARSGPRPGRSYPACSSALMWAVLLAAIGLAAGLAERPARVRDRRHRDLLLPHLDPGRDPDRVLSGTSRARDDQPPPGGRPPASRRRGRSKFT